MTKAVIVLDEMPVTCAVCPLLASVKFDYYYDESICMATGNEILDTKEVHRMCPIKEMPSMRGEMYASNDAIEHVSPYCEGFDNGWNACIEEIEE